MKVKQLAIAIGIVLLLLLCMCFSYAEEAMIVDNESVTIAISGFDKNMLSFGMQLSIENNTDDTLIFSLKDVKVNDAENDPLWATEVPPKSSKETSVNWYALGDLSKLDEITSISGTFRVYQKDNWNKPDITTADFIYYPGTAESVVVKGSEGSASGKTTVVDDERIMITVNNFENSSFLYCYGISVSLANRTNEDLMFVIRDVSVNGIECDPYWAAELQPDTEKTDTIGWFAESFEACGIEKVEQIKATFVVYEAGKLNPDGLFEKTVTLTP